MRIAPGIATTMRVFGALTILICSFTIFVYLKYAKFRSKSLHTVIFFISICSIFNAIGVCIGLPKNGTFECYLQAFLTNAFPLATIFWTTTIAYMVFCIIYKAEKIQVHSTSLMAVNFVLPALLTFLPLSTETYGSPEEDDWCFIKERASSNAPSWTTLFWSIFCFYGWLYLNVLVYILLLAVALRHIYVLRTGFNNDCITLDKMQSSLYKLMWYPLITLVVWLPAAIYDVTELGEDSSGRYTRNSAQYFAYLLPTTHGILICGAFFATNTDVKILLRELFQGRGLPDSSLLESLLSAERSSIKSDRGSSESSSSNGIKNKSKNKNKQHFTLSLSGSTGRSISASTSPAKQKSPGIPNPLGWTDDDGGGGGCINDDNYV